jgi:cobalt-zinc-cadmium efflux system outer membrane protein
MRRVFRYVCWGVLLATVFARVSLAQRPLSWDEVRQHFEANNPNLRAGQLGIDESRANEITAYLRPNPTATVLADQIDPFPGGPSHGPFAFLLASATVSYLHERRHKRELRLESAKEATDITVSGQADLERTLLFELRGAFVQTLQAKAILDLARENLKYYDHVLELNRERCKAGGMAKIDMERLELQRVQYESDLQTAEVNLITSKVQLLLLLNERANPEQFDVSGPFDFATHIPPRDEVRQAALDTRPDLREALLAVTKAKTDHQLAVATGSTDPTFALDVGRNPPIDQYVGVSVSIPLRIFDRNQGEKLRTQIDIDRNQRLTEAAKAQVLSDVDSAHATVNSTILLLQPYKDHYLQLATEVRDSIEFAYEHGAASLLDYMNAQADYRSVQVNYLNLIGSYLTAASQLNMAVGREVIP